MSEDKANTISVMCKASMVYTYFLCNVIYNYSQDNVKDYIIDRDLLDTETLLMTSSLLFRLSESILYKGKDNTILSNILDQELEKSLSKLFNCVNGMCYYNNVLVDNVPKTIFKIRNKLAHGEYLINKDKVTIIDGSNYMTFRIKDIVNLVNESLFNYMVRNKSNKYKSNHLYTSHNVPNRKRPYDSKEQIVKYINSFKVLSATIEGINGYKLTESDWKELDNKVDICSRRGNFKDLRLYSRSHDNIVINYGLEDINIDVDTLASNILTRTSSDVTYYEMTKYIERSINRLISDDINYITGSCLDNILLLDSIKKTKSYDINVIKDYIERDMEIDSNLLLSSLITMFNSFFIYPLNDFDSLDNMFIESNKLPFDKLDLSLFNTSNMKLDVGSLNNKMELLKSKEKSIIREKKNIVSKNIQLSNMVSKVSSDVYNSELSKFKKELIDYRKLINERNLLKKEINYFNSNRLYFNNKAIITGIRNSIAHGNYKLLLGKSGGDTSIVFDDIMYGVNTFHTEIYLVDFYNTMENNKDIVINYLNSMSNSHKL